MRLLLLFYHSLHKRKKRELVHILHKLEALLSTHTPLCLPGQ